MRTQEEIKDIYRRFHDPKGKVTEDERAFVNEGARKMFERAKEYKGAETENYVPGNTLSPEREAELTAHHMECEMPFFSCDLCYELYQNVGYQKYMKIRLDAGPTESEQHI